MCFVIFSIRQKYSITKEHNFNQFAHTQHMLKYNESFQRERRQCREKRMWYFYPLAIVSEMLSASNIEFYLFRHEFTTHKHTQWVKYRTNVEMKGMPARHSMKRN